MTYCQNCGTLQDIDAIFCSNCGTRMNINTSQGNNNPTMSSNPTNGNLYSSNYNGQSHSNAYQKTSYSSFPVQRTTELTIVLVLQYISLAIIGFISIFIFFDSPILGMLIFVILGLIYLLINSLQNYSDTARIIMIILLIKSSFKGVKKS